jgi:uncharacterized protein (DUF1501 family)
VHPIDSNQHTRRAFLRRSGQLALTGTALPFALNMAAFGEAAAFNATDYKALVCVFLAGGNDYANTVVTYDADSYDRYRAVRGGDATGFNIALARESLGATVLNPTTPLPGSRQYALHPSMTRMSTLFHGGQAAVQLNVGPLVVPLTRTQYQSADRRLYPVPARLFSHNDQQSTWQACAPEGSTVGWGGKIGDLALSSNGTSLFTCISTGGNAVFLAGDQALMYQVGPAGALPLKAVTESVYGSAAVRSAMSQLVRERRGHVLENEYNAITARSIDSQVQIKSALDATVLRTPTPAGNNLASQLMTVARLIGGRNILGSKRQVFFVNMGGFDLHDGLINGQASLMTRVSEAMGAFYDATVELGVAHQVTAFTASDFGRTLTSNGDGSDHGWGGHHFVVGGAVRGKALYGKAPPVSVGNTTAAEDQWHVGQGRLLPSTSVDQYAATLARWFGVADTEMAGILPNLRNFGSGDYPVNMGFMG